MAEWTGLEPATPGVTGRYSNQLNYRSAATKAYAKRRYVEVWWVLQGSNLRPTACKAVALPTELNTQNTGSAIVHWRGSVSIRGYRFHIQIKSSRCPRF